MTVPLQSRMSPMASASSASSTPDWARDTVIGWVKVPIVRCIKCQYEWIPFRMYDRETKTTRRPIKCPACQSPIWFRRNKSAKR
jgi:DNA-directed RNA polymerase subunit RPC12/RpoP